MTYSQPDAIVDMRQAHQTRDVLDQQIKKKLVPARA